VVAVSVTVVAPARPAPPEDPLPLGAPAVVDTVVDVTGVWEEVVLVDVSVPVVAACDEEATADVRAVRVVGVAPVPDPLAEPDPDPHADTPAPAVRMSATHSDRRCPRRIMSRRSGPGYCRPSRASRTSVTASGKTTAMTERNCSVCCSVVP
jgi:hypothetical protein